MQIFSNINNLQIAVKALEAIPKHSVATIGFFDGIHLGHKFLLKNLQETAQQEKTEEVVITMWQHPAIFFNRDLKLITTLEEKIRIFEKLNIKNLAILKFDENLSQQTSKEFVEQFLLEKLYLKELLLGYNNSFGSDKNKNIKDFNQIKITRLEKFLYNNSEKISSSEIRKLIEKGDVEKTFQYLGHPFELSGTVKEGFQIGRKLGFPTANIENIDSYKIIPANGVYITLTKFENSEKYFPSILNIGKRPTFNGKQNTIENHILNFDENIYNKNITIKFFKKIRNEQKFDNEDDLKKQVQKDIQEAKLYHNLL